MTETQSYTIEVLNIVPDNSLCFIQAPSIKETSALHQLLSPSPYDYYQQIILTPSNKATLMEIIKEEEIQESFHSIEIWHEKKLCFEGWDGMDSGQVSKDLHLPELFVRSYIDTEMCLVSNQW